MSKGRVLEIPEESIPAALRTLERNTQVMESGCIEWVGGTHTVDGYGVTNIKIGGRLRGLPAHRAAWMVHRGPLKEWQVLDHLCRVRNCVNVEHLEPVTSSVNTERGQESRKHLPPTMARPQGTEEKLWRAAKETAQTRGDNLSEIIRQALSVYVKQHKGEE